MTTISPERSIGARNFSTKPQNTSVLVAPSVTIAVATPSQRIAEIIVVVLQWPPGTESNSRFPPRARPYCRDMFVLAPLSSKKTKRSGSILRIRLFQRARCFFTSGRSCSLAFSVFFYAYSPTVSVPAIRSCYSNEHGCSCEVLQEWHPTFSPPVSLTAQDAPE